MVSLILTDRHGREHSLAAEPGRTVMEVIRDAGFDEMLALCGGCLSCATCHVQVDSDQFAALEPMSDDEDGLLDSSDHRQSNSRLSCQLPITPALDGLRITIAPDD